MPATSKAQQHFFGMLKAIKSGKEKAPDKDMAGKAGSMSAESIDHFASTPTRGLPEKAAGEKAAVFGEMAAAGAISRLATDMAKEKGAKGDHSMDFLVEQHGPFKGEPIMGSALPEEDAEEKKPRKKKKIAKEASPGYLYGCLAGYGYKEASGERELDIGYQLFYGGSIPNVVGGLTGAIVPAGGKRRSKYLSLLPGVGSFRTAQQAKSIQQDYKRRTGKTGNMWPEIIGTPVGIALGGLAGLAAGNLMAGKSITANPFTSGADDRKIQLPAMALGMALPAAIATLAAATSKTRTVKEQDADETTGAAVADYLVPGKAVYSNWKRKGLGYAKNLEK